MIVVEVPSEDAAAKLRQSCPTLCNSIDGSPPGSPIPGILQARTLQWVAISFSNAWKWKVKVKSLSHVRLFVTPWTAAYQAPPSMGFSRQEYWSGVSLPSPSEDEGGFTKYEFCPTWYSFDEILRFFVFLPTICIFKKWYLRFHSSFNELTVLSLVGIQQNPLTVLIPVSEILIILQGNV